MEPTQLITAFVLLALPTVVNAKMVKPVSNALVTPISEMVFVSLALLLNLTTKANASLATETVLLVHHSHALLALPTSITTTENAIQSPIHATKKTDATNAKIKTSAHNATQASTS